MIPFLLANTYQATLLMSFTLGALWFLRRGSAALRHQLCALGLMGCIALPALHAVMPAWSPRAAGSAVRLWDGDLVRERTSLAPQPAQSVRALTDRPPEIPWNTAIVTAWAIGAGFFLWRVGSGIARLFWLASHAAGCVDSEILAYLDRSRMRRRTRVLVGRSQGAIPCTWGFFGPLIVLPLGCHQWPADRKRMVMAHELAHIARFDWPLLIAAEVVRAFFWFHPLIWLAVHRLREESELASDDMLLKRGEDPVLYAGELLALVRQARQPVSAALAIARTTTLERRFTAMLNKSVNRHGLSRRAYVLTSAAALAAFIPLASLRAPAQETAGQFIGTVLDDRSAPIQNATVAMIIEGSPTRAMTTTGPDGAFRFESLPPGQYQLTVLRIGYSAGTVEQALEAGQSASNTVTLRPESAENLEMKSKADRAGAQTRPSLIRVGGHVQSANLTTKVTPVYPAAARSGRVQGQVNLEARIDREGVPSSLRVINVDVDPDLARSAVEAVSQWRYKPTLLNGEPIEVLTQISVNFTLSQ